MNTNRFEIVFRKLKEVVEREESKAGENRVTIVSEANNTEIEEIAELRRLVVETTEPDQHLFTTT